MSKALSPCILRFGGSAANFLTYDPDYFQHNVQDYEKHTDFAEDLIDGSGKHTWVMRDYLVTNYR